MTLRRTLRVWWAFSWRAFLLGIIVSFVAGVPFGILFGALLALLPQLAGVFTFLREVIIDGAVGLFVIYNSILDEDFSNFRVCLLPRKVAVPVPVPATPSTTA